MRILCCGQQRKQDETMKSRLDQPNSDTPTIDSVSDADGPDPCDVDVDNPAHCVHCGCTDDEACPEGCWWISVDRKRRIGLCSCCKVEGAGAWAAAKRAPLDR